MYRLPEIVFIGGDLLSNPLGGHLGSQDAEHFVQENIAWWIPGAREAVRAETGRNLRVFVIMGNDDPRIYEGAFLEMDKSGVLEYVNCRTIEAGEVQVSGYCFIPPSPFLLKDWEKYDVSRYVDPGSVSPEEGYRTVLAEEGTIRYGTIKKDLHRFFSAVRHEQAIYLFHSPPYNTVLDRADLEGVFVEHTPLDSHVGSIAIRRFIEKTQPRITLHGHIHESTRLTGSWREKIGKTWCFNAAHDGPELCLISFETATPGDATRELL